MPVVTQQIDAAAHLGVTPRTLRDWQGEAGFPDCSRGYDIEAITAWREREQRKGAKEEQAAKQIKLALLAQKLEQSRIRTSKDRLDLETKEKTLLPRKAVEQSAAVILSALSDLAEQLPEFIAAIVPPELREKVITRTRQELESWRHQLADDLQALPSAGESSR